jgi:CBS domain containing-hemolysin-like protein
MEDWHIVIITLVFSAFFSGMEIAFITSNKLKIELDRNKGLFAAKILTQFIKRPSKILGTLLLGNNIALVIYGISMARILDPVIQKSLGVQITNPLMVLFIQTVISTFLILIAAEFIPKALFRLKPNGFLNFFAFPLKVFYWLFYPVIYLLIGISDFIIEKVLGQKVKNHEYNFSPYDLDHYIRELTSVSNEENDVKQEIQMLQNAIDFRKVRLRECMVPRTEITAIENHDSIENLKSCFIESGHSKVLIYHESVDNIIGFVHSSDLFRNPANIISVMRSIPIVPETMLANNVLGMFIKEHKSIAVVVDEFGGTSGVVTMEDIIEEIFGEIEDEFDVEELTEMKISDHEFIFSARLEIDYINEKYQLKLPASEDYETLGGLIINIHESIPEIGEEIIFKSFKFFITDASDTRIEKVKLIVGYN